MSNSANGSCLCGAVTLKGQGTPKVAICHCSQCRKWHGGPAFGIEFEGGVQIVSGEDRLTWYESSEWAERGFCRICGSTLFYRLKAKPEELFTQAGMFDLPEGLDVTEHIFVDDQPDYYAFADDSPRVTGAELMERFQAEQGNSND